MFNEDGKLHAATTSLEAPKEDLGVEVSENGPDEDDGAALQHVFREEAFAWPRLVFPPLKKSGHIILDACTAEGTRASQ
jgi:ribosomal protein RSM22 (predicted rRNA methylase)